MVLADGAPLSSKQEKRRAKATAKAARRLRRNPSAATVDEVCAWLGTIELGGCAAAFLKHEVDGETLLELGALYADKHSWGQAMGEGELGAGHSLLYSREAM